MRRDWSPMPKEARLFPRGTEFVAPYGHQTVALLTEGKWDGQRMGSCEVLAHTLRVFIKENDIWVPKRYRVVDFDWCVLASNKSYNIWHTVKDEIYFQCIAAVRTPVDALRPTYLTRWRARLIGENDYEYSIDRGDTWRKPLDCITFPEPAPAPAPAPPPLPPEPAYRWPSREHRISVLASEMQTPLADRMLQVRRKP